MRLWSLHPKYLDNKGLVALWRESLLAKAVLEGKTIGYTNHPQLNRFKKSGNPLEHINLFLQHVYLESVERGYNFNQEKFEHVSHKYQLTVTHGQLKYEAEHLLTKLQTRDKTRHKTFSAQKTILPHPLFEIIDGEIEDWEILPQ